VTVVAACASMAAFGAASAHGAAKVGLEVTAGVHGYADAGEHVVVEASVTSDELINGALRVATRNSSVTTSVPLQVAAGTTKTIRVVVVTTYDMSGLEISVVDSGGRSLATKTAPVRVANDVELVGIMAQLFARAGEVPDQVNLPSDTGRAELSKLEVDVFDLGETALDAFDTIAASGSDVRALSTGQRTMLLSWVDGGGRLLLDDDSANDLLPTAWEPGDAGYAIAGRGEIRMSAGGAERGDWRNIIEPSAVTHSEGSFDFQEVFGDPQIEIADRAGIKLPELVPLLVAVGAYAIVIGPVMYLILRRFRRLTLVWVVLPVVAILVTGTIVVAGGRFRSSGSPASSSFVQTSPVGAVSFTSALVISRTGGSKTIDLPPGWSPDSGTGAYWGGPVQLVEDFVVDGAAGGAIHLSLEAGQVANVAYVGSTQRLGLTTTAALDGEGNIVGTVHNDTPYDLHDVAVFGGSNQKAIGLVRAGATADWSFAVGRANGPGGFGMPRSPSVWQSAVMSGMMPGFGPMGVTTSADHVSDLAEFGIWAIGGNRFGLYPTGLVRVAGWSDEVPSDVDLGRSAKSRTVLTALAPIGSEGNEPDSASVRAAIVRSPFTNNGGSGPLVYRYLLPPGALTDRLQIDLRGLENGANFKASAWDGSAWVDLEKPEGASKTPVPAVAVHDGAVLLRATVDQMNGNFDPNSIPPLGAAPEAAG